MKTSRPKNKGVVKGAPSGFAISLLVHGAAFLLAGMLVVFTVTQKEDKKFVPPKPVERPKMNLKKPKVKVKKTSKPKPTTRIVTKVKRANMPDIQLPEMSGMSDGLVGGIGGFEIMPDLDQVSLFGGGQTIGNDFVGTFYDFKRTRTGRTTPMDPHAFVRELGQFVRGDWKTSKIARYYRSPKKLYATTFMIPAVRSSVAPSAFGEADTIGYCWMAHYKGQLVHKDDIRFRFRGMGDDVMVVRVDGKVVLNACWPGGEYESESIASMWDSSSPDSRRYRLGNNDAVVGDWIDLKGGEPLDMEVMIGEVPGGQFASMLVVEVDGVEYPENYQGGPILPIFKTAEPNHDLRDAIYEWLVYDEACVTNGPVFNDFGTGSGVMSGLAGDTEEEEPVFPSPEVESPMRIWTTADGKSVEGEFISVIGDKVSLKTGKGKQVKIPKKDLSEEDRLYIELSNPPVFNISGTKSETMVVIPPSPYNESDPPRVLNYVFGAKLRQTSASPYNHQLNIEYFAIGQQYADDDKFILLDRQTASFTPTAENQRSFSFSGDPVEVTSFDLFEQLLGRKYYGYLVKVSDARGKTIQIQTSNKWLEQNLERLEQLRPGWFFDKTCTRVHPTGPKRNY